MSSDSVSDAHSVSLAGGTLGCEGRASRRKGCWSLTFIMEGLIVVGEEYFRRGVGDTG